MRRVSRLVIRVMTAQAMRDSLISGSRSWSRQWRRARDPRPGSLGCPAPRDKEFLNLYAGQPALEHTDLWPGSEAGARMVTYTRENEGTGERLERLHEIARGS